MSSLISGKLRVIEDYKICYTNPICLEVGQRIQLFQKDVPEKWRGGIGAETPKETKGGFRKPTSKEKTTQL